MKRTNRTVANSICAQLFGANIDIQFWLYYFDHTLRLLNTNSCAGMDSSCLEAAFDCHDNFKNVKYFGSCVWCSPPGDRDAKVKTNSQNSLFLGFLPDTTKNYFSTIKNLIISIELASSALMRASMIFLYNNSLQMASTFGILTMVLSFQLTNLNIVPRKILISLLALLLELTHATLTLLVIIHPLV